MPLDFVARWTRVSLNKNQHARYATSPTREEPRMAELYIGGEWREPVDGGRREIRCPADGSHVATVAEASAADTVAAILAARQAFDTGEWPNTPERERGALLLRVADLLERDAKDFARAESLDTGKRLVESEYDIADVVVLLPVLRRHRGHRRRPGGRHRPGGRDQPRRARAGRRVRADHAVELPAAADVVEGRARARGRQHVRAQAERADPVHGDPADARADRGRSAGRRREPGARRRARRSARRSPSTTPSTWCRSPAASPTGQRVMAAAAATVKKVALELGGKNPNVVFADADLPTAVDFALTAVFLHSGQVCSAGARLVVAGLGARRGGRRDRPAGAGDPARRTVRCGQPRPGR